MFRSLPVLGVTLAFSLLAISSVRYAGDVHWARVTVSLLCAAELPSGAANHGRELSIVALLILCVSMSWMFESISRTADSRGMQKLIQIAGIGSMVYALLTATPMHNLMVNIALIFFLVALTAIIVMLARQGRIGLSACGIGCLILKLFSVGLYYTDTSIAIWGVLQKLSFALTTAWLMSVHLRRNAIDDRPKKKFATELA